MKLTAGEIYFIGEREHQTGEITPFYKIGIVREKVKEDRSVEERLQEHQTGNPRPLFVHAVIKAHAVERVETLLHRRFAQSRGTGEWFRFDEATLSQAIEASKQFSNEISEHIPFVQRAQELERELSTDQVIESDEQMTEWYKKYHSANTIVKTFKALDKAILDLLKQAVARGEKPVGVSQQKTKHVEFFNLDRFKEEHPDVYGKYLVESQQFSQRFLVKPPADRSILELDTELREVAEDIQNQIESVRSGQETSNVLQPLRLVIFENVSNAEWTEEIAKAHLKVATGINAGIEGLTTWNRVYKTTTTFDKESFMGENFDLYKEFIELKQTGGGLKVDAGQAAAE